MTDNALIAALAFPLGDDSQGYPLPVRLAVEVATLTLRLNLSELRASHLQEETRLRCESVFTDNQCESRIQIALADLRSDEAEAHDEHDARLKAIYTAANKGQA